MKTSQVVVFESSQVKFNLTGALRDSLMALALPVRVAVLRSVAYAQVRGGDCVPSRADLGENANAMRGAIAWMASVGICEQPRRGARTPWRVTFVLNTED